MADTAGRHHGVGTDGSSQDFIAITKSDTVAIRAGYTTKAIYVGVAGNVVAINKDGDAITFTGLPIGWHPIRTIRVNSTNTTATNMVAIF